MMQESALAHAGFAKNGHMPPTIIRPDAKLLPPTSEGREAEGRQGGKFVWRGQHNRRLTLPALDCCHRLCSDGRGWQVEDRRKFFCREQDAMGALVSRSFLAPDTSHPERCSAITELSKRACHLAKFALCLLFCARWSADTEPYLSLEEELAKFVCGRL